MNKLTPAEVAAFTFRLTEGAAKPEAVAAMYRDNAATMRDYARKAAIAKSGKYRGYTEAKALESASECEARVQTVPAELRKLLA